MDRQQISSYSTILYYIIVALVAAGLIWAYIMPVELMIPGRGYVSFLGEAQAACVPEDGVVQSLELKSIGEVKEKQKILTYQVWGQGAAYQKTGELISPVKGLLVWQRDLIGGDMLKAGERVALIYPDSPVGIKVHLQDQELGRVQPGMPVRIKLYAYPFQNYGVLKGTVKELITQNAHVQGQQLELAVLITLEESADQRIMLRPGLTAGVEIITGKTRLLNKLLF